jgi:hypothetical protein
MTEEVEEQYLSSGITNETKDGFFVTLGDYDQIQIGKVLRDAIFSMEYHGEKAVLIYSTSGNVDSLGLFRFNSNEYESMMSKFADMRQAGNFHYVGFGKKSLSDNDKLLADLRVDKAWLRLQLKYHAKNYSLRTTPKVGMDGRIVSTDFKFIAMIVNDDSDSVVSLAHYLYYLSMFEELEDLKSMLKFDSFRYVERCNFICSK